MTSVGMPLIMNVDATVSKTLIMMGQQKMVFYCFIFETIY